MASTTHRPPCSVLAGLLLLTSWGLGCNDTENFPAPPASAAEAGADPEPGSEPEPSADDEDAEVMLSGFSWVTDELAGLPMPGRANSLDDDLTFLADQGVNVLVSLTESPVSEALVRDHGMSARHIPIPDFTAPTPEQIDQFTALVAEAKADGNKVAVHCLAGRGRTGTMLATWFVHEGQTAEQALARVRELRPGSVETAEQEQALVDYEQRLGNDANEPG